MFKGALYLLSGLFFYTGCEQILPEEQAGVVSASEIQPVTIVSNLAQSEPIDHDIGSFQVERGGASTVVQWTLRNDSRDDVLLRRIVASCACLVLEPQIHENVVIAAGSQLSVQAQILLHEAGPFRQSLTAVLSDREPVILRISGNVMSSFGMAIDRDFVLSSGDMSVVLTLRLPPHERPGVLYLVTQDGKHAMRCDWELVPGVGAGQEMNAYRTFICQAELPLAYAAESNGSFLECGAHQARVPTMVFDGASRSRSRISTSGS